MIVKIQILSVYYYVVKTTELLGGIDMKLNETIEMMNSIDYKERFKAEYYQLKIRFCGLMNMLDAWNNDKLTFEPTCPRSTYDLQLRAMRDYMSIIEMRAVMEHIDLDTSFTAV